MEANRIKKYKDAQHGRPCGVYPRERSSRRALSDWQRNWPAQLGRGEDGQSFSALGIMIV